MGHVFAMRRFHIPQRNFQSLDGVGFCRQSLIEQLARFSAVCPGGDTAFSSMSGGQLHAAQRSAPSHPPPRIRT